MAQATPRDGIQNLRTLKHTHTAALTAGDILLVNGQVLIAVNDSLANAENTFIYRGRAEFPKTAPLVINPGDKCYWDDTAKELNKTSAGNTAAGICVEPAASADTVVNISLHEN